MTLQLVETNAPVDCVVRPAAHAAGGAVPPTQTKPTGHNGQKPFVKKAPAGQAVAGPGATHAVNVTSGPVPDAHKV